MAHKICFKCHRELLLDEFYRHPKMVDGHIGKCKDCARSDALNYRLAKLEHYRRGKIMFRNLRESVWALLPDKCQVHGCNRAGMRGNENRASIAIGKYVLMCDYCWSQYKANVSLQFNLKRNT